MIIKNPKPILPGNNTIYLENQETINKEIEKRIHRWKLTSILYMQQDDVKQILRLHVLRKINQWKPEKGPLSHWLNKILTNRIHNLIRDHYGAHARPCLDCPFFGGGEVCKKEGMSGIQSPNCPDFYKWFNGKRYKLEINMAHSIDATLPGEEYNGIKKEIVSKQSSFIDFTHKIPEFNKKMKDKCTVIEYKVFSYLYIDHLNEIETAIQMNYRTCEENKPPGYKQIQNLKARILVKAKEVVKEMDFN